MAEEGRAAAAVVAGTDGSESATATLLQAASLAEASRAPLHVVCAVPADERPPREHLQRVREGVEQALDPFDIDLYWHPQPGDPATALCRVAGEVDAGLIVVGNRGAETVLPWKRRQAIFDQVRRMASTSVLVVDTEPYWRPVVEADRAAAGTGGRVAREWKVLAVTTLAVFMAFLDVTIVNVAFPSIRESFSDTSLNDLSWVLNAYNVVFAAMLIPAGRLADRLGRRRVFYGGLWLFLLGSVLCGAAPSAEALIGARVVQAIGAAALIPASLSLLLPEFAPERRAIATSVWAAAGAVAAATGPSLGGVLVDWGGWRWAFFVNLVIALGVLPGRRLLVERRDPEAAGAQDVLGGAMLASAVGLLALGIVKAPDWGWTDSRVVISWLAFAALVGALVLRAGRHPAPVLEPELLRIPLFAISNLAMLVFSAGFYALLLCNVLFLTEVWGYSTLEAGFGVTPGPVAAAVAAAIGGRVVEARGPRIVAVPGALAAAGAALLYRALPGADPSYLAEWLPAQVLSGAAVGLVFAALATATVMDLPPNRLATGTALSSCGRQIGAVLGIAGLIAILDAAGPQAVLGAFDDAWLVMALCYAATAGIAWGFTGRRPGEIAEGANLRHAGRAREVPGLERAELALPIGNMVVRSAGDGPPVLLVHGLLDSSLTWRKVAPALALGHRVIAPDLFGHGESEAPRFADYGLGGHAGALRDLLDRLGVEKVTVVGHSLGGGVALSFSYLFPERVERVVLVSSGGLGSELSPVLRAAIVPGAGLLWRTVGARPVLALLQGVAALAQLARLRGFARGLLGLRELFAQLADAGSRGAFLNTARAVIDRRGQKAHAVERLETILPFPLLLLWGTRDRIIPVRHGEAALEAHPRAELALLEGVGHSPQLAQPAFVAERIAEFVAAPVAEEAAVL